MGQPKRYLGYATDVVDAAALDMASWTSMLLTAGEQPEPLSSAARTSFRTGRAAGDQSSGSNTDGGLTGDGKNVDAGGKAPATTAVPTRITEVQLDGYSYAATSVYGSNIVSAWRYGSGQGVSVSLVDDGSAAAATSTFFSFSTALSRAFGASSYADLSEPQGSDHGTTTAGMIAAPGGAGTPEGLAPNATVIGIKAVFSNITTLMIAQAEQYAASVAPVVNNSWDYSGYATGEPNSPGFAVWYAVVQQAVSVDRHGLGDVLVFAAGNGRTGANSLAVQPVNADYRVIAVAATNADGQVAYYSNPGAALLVSAIGDNVAVETASGSGSAVASGTSYAAPTVSAIAALMLAANPNLGWRDVQEILADSAYMPPPSASGFTVNGATGWNGGGMHFSNDLGFGVVDANVAVNLARAWTEQSDTGNMASATVSHAGKSGVAVNGTTSVTLTDHANIRVQHVEVTITDTGLPVAWSKVTLISPDGTASVLLNQVGLVDGTDQTGGLDVSGLTLTSNAFWGENATGTWTVQVQDIGGAVIGAISHVSLSIQGDAAASSRAPLVYTPEFAALAATAPARTIVQPGQATTIDLIALPNATMIDLNGGAGVIDGVAVTVERGLTAANADGSTGPVTLTGLTRGGSELTGGDAQSVLTGYGNDTINAGLGATTINTGAGGSRVTLTSLAASTVTINSGGHDAVYAGTASATVSVAGNQSDTVYAQSAMQLSFIAGSATIVLGSGSASIIDGGLSDILQFKSGSAGGLDTISGFRIGIDDIDPLGFSASQIGNTIRTEKSDGMGGVLLTFSDNTRLDLLGIGVGTVTQSSII